MTETLEHRIATALAQIPHGTQCYKTFRGQAEPSGTPTFVAWFCVCDREARQAALVAKAIEATANWHMSATGATEAGVRVLESGEG